MVFPFLDVRELQSDPIHQLSRKERVMLEALSKGLTNRELSKELEITVNTVKFHLSKVFMKLGIRSRSQLPIALAQRGVTEPPIGLPTG